MEVCIYWSIALVRFSVFDIRHLPIQRDQRDYRSFCARNDEENTLVNFTS
jgi:hypothetical protein